MALIPVKPSQVPLAYNSGSDVDITNDVLIVGSSASGGQVAKLSPTQLRDAIIPTAGQRYWNVDPGPGFGDEYSYTDDVVLTADQDGAVINNAGAAKAITVTLPAAIAGMEFAIDRVALFSIAVAPDGTDTISLGNPGSPYVINADGLTVFTCAADTSWRVSVGAVRQYFLDIRDNGASAVSTPAANLAALQAKLAASPVAGSTILIPQDSGPHVISDTFAITNRVSVRLMGLGTPARNSSLTGGPGPSALKVDAGWPTTKALIQVTSTAAETNAYLKGGNQFTGLSLMAGASPWTGGYGLHILKGALDTQFWGDIIVDNTVIYNGNIGIFLDDTVVGGNGFGWITVDKAKIESNLFGIKSNTSTNVVRIRDSNIRWNNQTSSSNYITRTGGGIVLSYGSPALIHGNNLEGQQVGFQSISMNNLDIRANYCEAMNDASFVFIGATDVIVENNYLSTGTKAKHIYFKDCNRVREAFNRKATPIIALANRDIDTDSPRNLRFTTEVNSTATSGTQVLDDYGYWLQSIPQRMPTVRPDRSSNRMIHTITTANLSSVANYAGLGPDGNVGKCVVATAGAVNGYVSINWDSSDIAIVEGQWVVISARILAPSTNAAGNQLYFEVRENVNGGGSTLKCSGGVAEAKFGRGEWVTFQWFHKVLAGETTYRASVRLRIPENGGKLVYGGAALNVVEQPAITPMYGYFGTNGNTSYIADGFGSFYGAAAPADTNLVWADGERVYFSDAVSGTFIGTVCTTPGTGGGTAVFNTFGAIT